MSNKVNEKKQYKLWQLAILGIILIPFVVVLLGFIVLLAPFLMLGYIMKMLFDLRAEKYDKALKLEYKLKTDTNLLKLELAIQKLKKC